MALSERRATFTIDSTFHTVHAGGDGQTLFVELSKRFPQRADDVQSLTIVADSPAQLRALLEELIDDLEAVHGYAEQLGQVVEDED